MAASATVLVRPFSPSSDSPAALVEVGRATGLFSAEEADALLGATLAGLADGSLAADSHAALVAEGGAGDSPLGWCYLARDAQADRVWELMWIGVTRAAEGTSGAGSALLKAAEALASERGARLLLISTSSTPATARARAFYERKGFARCGAIPDYYAAGDDKVIYSRSLTSSP